MLSIQYSEQLNYSLKVSQNNELNFSNSYVKLLAVDTAVVRILTNLVKKKGMVRYTCIKIKVLVLF